MELCSHDSMFKTSRKCSLCIRTCTCSMFTCLTLCHFWVGLFKIPWGFKVNFFFFLISAFSSAGRSDRPTSSSLWCASSPQRAVEPVGWFAWLKQSNVASLVASRPPSSRRPWRSTKSWTCGRSTRPARASLSSEQPGTRLHAHFVSVTWGRVGDSLLWVFYRLVMRLSIL